MSTAEVQPLQSAAWDKEETREMLHAIIFE